MEKRIFELSKEGIAEITEVDYKNQELKKSSIYLFDFKTKNRSETSDELLNFGVKMEVCEYMLEPDSHIRFEYMDDTAYGELAYFSEKSMKPHFVAVISHKNLMFVVHEIDEGILDGVIEAYPSFTESQKKKMNAEFLLYILINEMLSLSGKMILSYREEIEVLALDFDNKDNEISPEDILEAKSHLADLSRVMEKLFYTLSFPPAKDILDLDSPYRLYFKELLKTMGFLKISLTQTEERLNSLQDHFQLILQNKSNKRLNFLTIIQAIFVPLTLLAGIYGMNFQYMPELNYKYGYFFSLAAMLIIAVIFLRYFYKHGWFDH